MIIQPLSCHWWNQQSNVSLDKCLFLLTFSTFLTLLVWHSCSSDKCFCKNYNIMYDLMTYQTIAFIKGSVVFVNMYSSNIIKNSTKGKNTHMRDQLIITSSLFMSSKQVKWRYFCCHKSSSLSNGKKCDCLPEVTERYVAELTLLIDSDEKYLYNTKQWCACQITCQITPQSTKLKVLKNPVSSLH